MVKPVTPPLIPATPTVPPVAAPPPPPQLALPLAPVAKGSAAAERAGGLGLPDAVLKGLSVDERAMLVLLKENGSARSTELAALVGRSPARLPGQMTQLGRALHKAGCPRFETQDLPSGEILYRYVAGEDA